MNWDPNDAGRNGGLVWGLGRADGPRMVLSIWFAAGAAVALLGTGIFVSLTFSDRAATWHEDAWTVHSGFLLMSLFVMIAANAASLRDLRARTTEQHQALPIGGAARVEGLTTAVLWPAGVSTLLLASVAAFASTRVEVPSLVGLYVLHNGALVLMMGALGVALGAWVTSSFAAPVLAFTLYLVHPSETPTSAASLWPFASPQSEALMCWHIALLAGLTLILLAVAESRWTRRRHQLRVLLTGGALACTAAVVLVTQSCPQLGTCGP